jgi:type I restriction enzyme S subunit
MKGIANYSARNQRINISSYGFYDMLVLIPQPTEQTVIANILTIADRKSNF